MIDIRMAAPCMFFVAASLAGAAEVAESKTLATVDDVVKAVASAKEVRITVARDPEFAKRTWTIQDAKEIDQLAKRFDAKSTLKESKAKVAGLPYVVVEARNGEEDDNNRIVLTLVGKACFVRNGKSAPQHYRLDDDSTYRELVGQAKRLEKPEE